MARGMAGAPGRLIVLATILVGGVAAAADTPVSAFAGRYSHHFENGDVSGNTYWSDNVVEIVPVAPRHAYVNFSLQFFNGHQCTLSGVAETSGGGLVYRETAASSSDEGPCTLTIRRQGAKLTWEDQGSCKAHCGSRGGFSNGNIAWSSKRPIRYMARLKASSEYRDALAEWRSGRK